MSRPPRPLALLGLALLGLADALSTRAAAADSPAATPSAAPAIVLLAPELDRSDVDDRAVGTLGARVRAAGIQVVVVRRKVPELHALAAESKALIATWGARGALWVDIGRSDEAALYLVTRDSEQVFGRTIPAPEGKTSATLETLANIAASVAEELLEGRIVELSPVKVPDPPPERTAPSPSVAGEPVREPQPSVKTEVASPAPPPRTKPRQASPDSTAAPPLPSADADPAPRFPRIGLSVGYTGDTFGDLVPWQSAVSALLTLAPSPSAFLNLGHDFVIPTHVRRFPAGYDLARHPLVALGGYRFPVSSWDFRLGARMAMDIIEQTLDPFEPPPPPPGAPPPPPPPRQPITSEIQILFTAGPALEVGYLFADRFRASAFLGVEFLLNRPSPIFHFLDLRADPVRLITGLSLGVDLFVPEEARSRPRSASAEPEAR